MLFSHFDLPSISLESWCVWFPSSHLSFLCPCRLVYLLGALFPALPSESWQPIYDPPSSPWKVQPSLALKGPPSAPLTTGFSRFSLWPQLASVLALLVPGFDPQIFYFSRYSFSSGSSTTRILSFLLQTQSFQKAVSSSVWLWIDKIRITYITLSS